MWSGLIQHYNLLKINTLLAQKFSNGNIYFFMLVIKGAAKEPFDIDVFYDNK